LCEGGYYCDGGSTTPTPSGVGGDKCLSGYYCPEGSGRLIDCVPGEYCAGDFLNATSGSCDPGYYCILGASEPNPTDGTTGRSLDYLC